jgi:hypothetical protein
MGSSALEKAFAEPIHGKSIGPKAHGLITIGDGLVHTEKSSRSFRCHISDHAHDFLCSIIKSMKNIDFFYW